MTNTMAIVRITSYTRNRAAAKASVRYITHRPGADSRATSRPLSATDIEAIGRVVFAEAGNQPVSGKVAVINTILNRLESGQFGSNLQAVLSEPHAFEPVFRAGGWQNLPALNVKQQTELLTILGLIAEGSLAGVGGQALYFQNETIVRERARAGSVSPGLIGFGGMPQTALIGDHTFYRPLRGAGEHINRPPPRRKGLRSMFVGGGGDEATEADPALFGEKETIVQTGEK